MESVNIVSIVRPYHLQCRYEMFVEMFEVGGGGGKDS